MIHIQVFCFFFSKNLRAAFIWVLFFQFDTTATAVIMTRCSTRERYIQMLNGADIIESR